jgi:hypothetical protein
MRCVSKSVLVRKVWCVRRNALTNLSVAKRGIQRYCERFSAVAARSSGVPFARIESSCALNLARR